MRAVELADRGDEGPRLQRGESFVVSRVDLPQAVFVVPFGADDLGLQRDVGSSRACPSHG